MTDFSNGPAAPFPEPPPVQRRTKTPVWAIALVAALGGLLIGGLGGAAVGALAVRQTQGDRDYEIVAFLEQPVAEDQRATIRAAVEQAAPGPVETRTAQENFEIFQKRYANDPDLLAGVRPESFRESLLYRTRGADPDCRPVRAIRQVAGVQEVIVHMLPDGDRLEGSLSCLS